MAGDGSVAISFLVGATDVSPLRGWLLIDMDYCHRRGKMKTAAPFGNGGFDVQLKFYRYCLIRSEALAGSSETLTVTFMLLASANFATQLMNSSP